MLGVVFLLDNNLAKRLDISRSGKNRNRISVGIFSRRANKSENLFEYKEMPK